MTDLILAVIGMVFAPVAAIAVFCALTMIVRTIFQNKSFRWYFLVRALFTTLLLETVFVFFGGALIAFTVGRNLGYGVPIVVCLTTLLFGIFTFFWLQPIRQNTASSGRSTPL